MQIYIFFILGVTDYLNNTSINKNIKHIFNMQMYNKLIHTDLCCIDVPPETDRNYKWVSGELLLLLPPLVHATFS